MFKKKIVIKDDSLIIGRKKILWGQIIGIREQNNPAFQKISNRFPRADIFLKGGKVLIISKFDRYQNQSSFPVGFGEIEYESIMTLLRKNATNLNPLFERWFEWRLILPIALIELITFVISIITGRTFEQAVLMMIFAGILGSAIGWGWERKERKKY